MERKIRIVGRAQTAAVFAYFNDVFACNGLDWSWPSEDSSWIDSDVSKKLRALLHSEKKRDKCGFLKLTDANDSWIVVSQNSNIPLIIAGFDPSIPTSKRKERTRLIEFASSERSLHMYQQIAASFAFEMLATHGIPNVTKWFVSACDKLRKSAPELAEMINEIDGGTRQLRSIRNSAKYMRPTWVPDGVSGKHPIHKALMRTKGLLKQDMSSRKVEIYIEKTDMKLKCVENDFSFVLYNLMLNAVKYSMRRTKVTVSTSLCDAWLSISFKSKSLKICPDEVAAIRRLSVRGLATKWFAPQEGSGVGLTIVERVVEAYGGALDILPGDSDSDDPRFADNEFRIRFPRSIIVAK